MVDLSSLQTKLKSLSVEGVSKLKEIIGDGKKSSRYIFSVAGETVALSETEQALLNKKDFEALYVPASLKSHQSELEELYIRMFPLTASQSKGDVLPPDDPALFDLLRESLHFRLENLRQEILADTSDSVDIREKLSRFDRLGKLIENLERSFRKKQTQTYLAVVSSSEAPPSKEPKMPLSQEEIDQLLRQFGLILLQSQHQLPGFTFPVSPNQIVSEVRSSKLDDEEGFLEEVAKEGKVSASIQDVIHPDEKETRLLETLSKKLDDLFNSSLFEKISEESREKLDASGKTFEENITNVLTSLFEVIRNLETTAAQADQVVEGMDKVISDLERERNVCNQKLSTLAKGAEESKEHDEEDEEKKEDASEEVKELTKQRDEIAAHLEKVLGQMAVFEKTIADKQSANLQREEAIRQLGSVSSELESLKLDSAQKTKTIEELRLKESELDTLRTQVSELEEQESLSKQEKRELEEKARKMDSISEEKQALEQRLADYDENLKEIQALVNAIPVGTNMSESSPFEQLRTKILSILPLSKDTDPAPTSVLNLPIVTLPTFLEIRAAQKTYTCLFLERLSTLVSQYFDSAEGQALQARLTTILDTIEQTIPAPLLPVKFLSALKYGAIKDDEWNTSSLDANITDVLAYPSLKEESLITEAESVFFQDQDQLRTQIQSINKKLDEKELPSYPVLFFAYLLALRDWVNCVEINSRPLECPQIPPRLQRTVKCK